MNHEQNRELIAPLRSAMYNWSDSAITTAIGGTFAPDAVMQLAFPFETMAGPLDWFETALKPLARAMPDLERRDFIVAAGEDPNGSGWVGCAGHYSGTWVQPFLDIPATGHLASMRFHEFFRVVDGRIVEMQALWDIPELMMQSGCWPMNPSLGREWLTPGPATLDGVRSGRRDQSASQKAADHVVGMLMDMGRHPTGPPEAMRLEHWWHPRFNWYGPAGIGSSRGVDGFRRHHQIPFLDAFPDRRGGYKGDAHFFADGNIVGVTAWPGMAMTHTGSGWLGLPATEQSLTMRSLDFWRVEAVDGRLAIRENWVLVDLLDVYNQLGIDVFARMQELTMRHGGL